MMTAARAKVSGEMERERVKQRVVANREALIRRAGDGGVDVHCGAVSLTCLLLPVIRNLHAPWIIKAIHILAKAVLACDKNAEIKIERSREEHGCTGLRTTIQD